MFGSPIPFRNVRHASDLAKLTLSKAGAELRGDLTLRMSDAIVNLGGDPRASPYWTLVAGQHRERGHCGAS